MRGLSVSLEMFDAFCESIQCLLIACITTSSITSPHPTLPLLALDSSAVLSVLRSMYCHDRYHSSHPISRIPRAQVIMSLDGDQTAPYFWISRLLVRTSALPLLHRLPSLSLPFFPSPLQVTTTSHHTPIAVHRHHHLTSFPETTQISSLASEPARTQSPILLSRGTSPCQIAVARQSTTTPLFILSDASLSQLGPGIAVQLAGSVGVGGRGLHVPRGQGGIGHG